VNRYYFRLRVHGLSHLLSLRQQPALLVGNHNGGIAGPDLVCTMATLLDALGPDAPLYALAHDVAMRFFRPLGWFVRKLGALAATVDNAEHALSAGAKVLVYPGGDLDAYRHFRDRNRIVFGQRTGFVRVAQRTGAPIVPIVAYGAHRSAYIFEEGDWLAEAIGMRRRFRVSRFPLALALPYGLALGPFVPYFPLPFAIRLCFLPPIFVSPDEDAQQARERVRERMQEALDQLARES
jgi:1-acyl-sn-glycerol-3-phosphate acyltransferase